MKKFIPIALLTIALSAFAFSAGCRYLEKRIMDTKPLPTNLFLGELSSDTMNTSMRWPNAEPWSFHILAALPVTSTYSASRSIPEFKGSISVTEATGANVEELVVSTDTAQTCNWLPGHSGVNAVILTWNITNRFERCVQGQTYNIEVTFWERPAEFESLWLSFLQSAEHKRAEESEQESGHVRK